MKIQSRANRRLRKAMGILGGLWLVCIANGAEEIDRIEYFIGDDPGLGNGTEVLADGSAPINIDISTSASLSPGHHRLHFRARDVTGTWGLTSSVPFRIRSTDNLPTEIDAVEYFIDAEPGLGGGIDPAPSGGFAEFNSDIPETGSLPPGPHRLHFRTRGTDGRWGLTSSIPFRIREPDPGPPMDYMDYVVRHRDGTMAQEAISLDLPSLPFMDTTLSFDPSGFRVFLERYSIQVVFQSLFGTRSEEQDLVEFLVTAPDTDWVNAYFSQTEIENGDASFRLDHDDDGLPTGSEYGTLTSPIDPSAVSRPVFFIENDFFHLRYLQRSGGSGTAGLNYKADGMTFLPHSSVGPGGFNWATGPAHVVQVGSPVPAGAGLEEVTVRQTTSVSESGTGFMHVEYR